MNVKRGAIFKAINPYTKEVEYYKYLGVDEYITYKDGSKGKAFIKKGDKKGVKHILSKSFIDEWQFKLVKNPDKNLFPKYDGRPSNGFNSGKVLNGKVV